MRVIALDPGKATGMAEWENRLLGWSHSGGHKAWVLPYADALEYVERHTKYGYCQLVVCEDFTITARTLKTGSGDWRRGAELEFIGVVRWLCSKHGVELALQLPAEAFGFSSDEKLKRIGWWTPGPDHSRSASKHLLRALAHRRLIDPKDLLAE